MEQTASQGPYSSRGTPADKRQTNRHEGLHLGQGWPINPGSMIKLAILAADAWLRDADIRLQLSRDFELHDFSDWQSWDAPTLLKRIRSVEIAITSRASPRLPEELAENFGHFRYLCHAHGSIRHLASKRLLEKGLIVTNWGEFIAGVAEGAMALLLCQLKQLVTLDRWTKGGPDERIYQMFPCTLEGRDVGLYGFGPIGRHMARMLEPFGPKIAIYDPYAKNVPAHIRVCPTLRELFATCQIISIHCGLNDSTRDSVTRELLELLPQGGIVINTARGHIVDEQALAELVGKGRLLAGIDVIRSERNWAGSPLARHSGAVLTHHRVGSGKGYPPGHRPKPQLPEFIVKNLAAYRQGKPLINVVTAEEYDLKT